MDFLTDTLGKPILILFRGLLNQAGMILVFAFIFSRVPFFRSYLLSSRRRLIGTVSFIVFFGLLGILGTYTGIPVRGALANSRIIGVFVAGLLGGPIVGIGAGLIAGFHRWAIDIGGFTAFACMVSTVAESAMAGYLSEAFYRSKNKWGFAMLAGAAAEVVQMILILVIAKPFDEAVALVQIIGFPMIVANGFGIGMFIAIIESIFRERDQAAADQAQTTLRIASQTIKHFREGFNESSAEKNARIILSTLKVAAVSFTDTKLILSHVGVGADHHVPGSEIRTNLTREVLNTGMYRVASSKEEIGCGDPGCRLRSSITVPLQGKGKILGTLKIYKDFENGIGPVDVELALGLANLFATQIELSQLEDQNKLLAKAELQALQAQINPHFLFNAINTIASLTRSDPETARELLIHLGSFFRKNLAQQDDLVPLREELEQVRSYLRIEQARFGDKLNVEFSVPDDAECLLPPLLLQPIVENAVKHGIQKKIGAGKVVISARNKKGETELTVTDDGIGMDDERVRSLFSEERGKKSIGLMNINARLVNLYGPEYALSVSSEIGTGTTVRMRIPREGSRGNDSRSPRR
ncbi:MAG: sensor histidine kinase [Treponemataceae bacterium]